MTPKGILKKTGWVKSFDGTNIYYEVRGEGPPILFAYGIGCLINHWQHQIKYFSNSYQTIVFDYRAHHKSETPEDQNQLTIDALARDIQAILDELQIPSASMVGHSFGVQVLIRAYDMFPERFENLVLINGFVSNPLRGMFGNDLASNFFHLFKTGYEILPESLSYLWKLAINNPLAIQLSALAGGFNINLTNLKDIEIYARGISSIELKPFINLFEKMMNYEGFPVLERISVPTLIIGGKKDSVTPPSRQEGLHQQIRGSQLLIVPYGSHCTQLDMPELVNLRMQKFYYDSKYVVQKPK